MTSLALMLLVGCGQVRGERPPGASTGTPAGSGASASADEDASAATGAGAVLTQEDSGTTLELAPGEEASVRLAPPLQDVEPAVDRPEVVEVVRVDHLVDPGYAEYQLLAGAAGRARVSATDPASGQEILVEVVVSDG